MFSEPNTSRFFAFGSLDTEAPVRLVQCEWRNDETFVSILRASWQSQYADYIGSEAAHTLINEIHHTGEIYIHSAKSTLVATLDDRKVGIMAIRELDKICLITLLEVLPEHQRKGIASHILSAYCVTNKPLLVHVSIHRPWLKDLYKEHGFRCLAPEVIDHYGHPMMFNVMAKT